MEYIPFGKLGFEVSRFGLGCMRLPLKVQPDGTTIASEIDEEKAIEMIRYAVDHGVNYFDTANGYHGGNSKKVLGKALRGGYRQKVKVATKLPPDAVKDASDFEKLLQANLEALQTDCIDFYLVHGLDKDSWKRMKDLGILGFLDDCVEKGKIRYPSFSFHGDLETFKEIIDSYHWSMCQIQFNILDVKIQAGLEGLRYAASKGIPVVVMEPLKGGKLSNDVPEDILAKWDESPIKRSPQSWAFHWLSNMPEVTVVLSGSSTLEQVKDSLDIFKTTGIGIMSEKELILVDEVRKMYQSKIKVGCTACNYCMPCPSGVDIPKIFKLYNDAFIYDSMEGNRKSYENLIAKSNDASKCTGCGNCESICPQALSIIKGLKEIHEYFTV